MGQFSLGVSNLAMDNSHARYCGLVRGPHVEEEESVVCLNTYIIVKFCSLYTVYRRDRGPRDTTWV